MIYYTFKILYKTKYNKIFFQKAYLSLYGINQLFLILISVDDRKNYVFFFIDDNNLGLSSPIHRTEEKFTAEEKNNVDYKPVKRGARLDRLAALASTINNWEDDLSHPTLTNSKVFYNI